MYNNTRPRGILYISIFTIPKEGANTKDEYPQLETTLDFFYHDNYHWNTL